MTKTMKKTMNSLCRCLLVLVLACSANSVMGQQLRYVQTKIVNETGEHAPNGNFSASVIIFEFQQNGNILVQKSGSSYVGDFRYRFHHSDGGNNVYYQITNNPQILNCGMEIVVSGDRNTINMNNYNTSGNQQVKWNWTVVYKHQEAESRGMYY